jgi:hypothetical protein
MSTLDDEARLRELVKTAPWKSTSYIQPHQYFLEHWAPEAFRALAALIASPRGYYGRFLGRRYRYVQFDGFKYWRIEDCINRERLPEGEEGSHAAP